MWGFGTGDSTVGKSPTATIRGWLGVFACMVESLGFRAWDFGFTV